MTVGLLAFLGAAAGLATALLLPARLSHAFVFRPSRRDLGSPAVLRLPFEDLALTASDGRQVHGWWIPGRGEGPAILFLHGTRGNLSSELPMLRFLHSLGADLLAVDYPGYGRSPGRPSEKGCLAAADAAWDLLQARRPGAGVVLYGRSLGCAMAAYLAARQPCAGLVLHGGFTSIPDLAAHLYPRLRLLVRVFCRVRMDALAWIAGCRAPLLVLHAPRDRFIPLAQALRVYARAAVPKRFVPLPGDHEDESWMQSPAVREALGELLAGRAAAWTGGDPVY